MAPYALQMRPESAPPQLRQLRSIVRNRLADVCSSQLVSGRPPTFAEVIVCALVTRGDSTVLELVEYAKNGWLPAVDHALNQMRLRRPTYLEAAKVVIRMANIPVMDASSEDSNPGLQSVCTARVSEARVFLQDFLSHPEDKEHSCPFRFMDLPPEIQCRIIDLVVCFPPSGILIRREKGEPSGTRVYVATRSYQKDYRPSLWDHRGDSDSGKVTLLACPPLGNVLALLSVSQAIRAESLSFYSINCFVCQTPDELFTLLLQTSMWRRRHFKRIVVPVVHDLDPGWFHDYPEEQHRQCSEIQDMFWTLQSTTGEEVQLTLFRLKWQVSIGWEGKPAIDDQAPRVLPPLRALKYIEIRARRGRS